jgi:hypothetical protein
MAMTRSQILPVTRCIGALLLVSALFFLPCAALDLTTPASASSSAPAISNGDSVRLHGIATGHPRNGLQVWVIGKNYLKVSTIQVNDDNTFEFELKPSDTRSLASGQYYVVVQHPMMNGQFDVYLDPSGNVVNRQQGAGGMAIFTMAGSGSLQGPDSAQALVEAISSQNIDDSFTTYTFAISPPTAFIDPIGDHAVGDKFTISGSTNLAVGDNLMVEITSSSFRPTQKSAPGGFSGANGMVTVVPGTGGYNRWSFAVDAATFQPDEYIVKVSGITVDVTGSTTFNVLEKMPVTTIPSVILTETRGTVTATQTQAPLPTATTPARSPVAAGIVISGLAVAALMKRRM